MGRRGHDQRMVSASHKPERKGSTVAGRGIVCPAQTPTPSHTKSRDYGGNGLPDRKSICARRGVVAGYRLAVYAGQTAGTKEERSSMSEKRKLDYEPHGYKRGQPIAVLTYSECGIEIIHAGQEMQTIVGSRDGDTMRSRIAAFVDLARQERGAKLAQWITDLESGALIIAKSVGPSE